LPSPILEEPGQDVGTRLFQNSGGPLDLVVESRIIEQAVQAPASAGFGVVGSVDQAIEATLDDRPGAHRARFEGGVQGATIESPGSSDPTRLGENEAFRVSRRIGEPFGQVVTRRDDCAGLNHQRPDGDFPLRRRVAGQIEADSHHGKVEVTRSLVGMSTVHEATSTAKTRSAGQNDNRSRWEVQGLTGSSSEFSAWGE